MRENQDGLHSKFKALLKKRNKNECIVYEWEFVMQLVSTDCKFIVVLSTMWLIE